MIRKIAIAMTTLMLAVTVVGCGSQYDGNVSDTTNGTVNSSSGRYRDGLRKSDAPEDRKETTYDDSMASNNGSIMDDAKDAVTDIGRAVDDTMIDSDQTAGTGMTGNR